jgi:hypothetical protein
MSAESREQARTVWPMGNHVSYPGGGVDITIIIRRQFTESQHSVSTNCILSKSLESTELRPVTGRADTEILSI